MPAHLGQRDANVIVAAVATNEPQIAPNAPEASTAAIASPRGSVPSRRSANSNSASDAALRREVAHQDEKRDHRQVVAREARERLRIEEVANGSQPACAT